MAVDDTHLRLVPPPDDDGAVLDTTPPHDNEAEEAVICLAITDPKSLPVLCEFLKPDDFFREPHRLIFAATMELFREGAPIDIATVGSRLKKQGQLSSVGGLPFMAGLLNAAPIASHVRAYGAVVYERSRARKALVLAQRLVAEAFLNHGPEQEWLDRFSHDLADIANRGLDGGAESTLDAIRRIIREMMQRDASPYRDKMGIPYGIRELDNLLLGLHGNQMTILSALPGRGKTSLALQVATHVASLDMEVLFFSLEQTRDELLLKVLSRRARVDSHRLLKPGELSSAEWSRLSESVPGIERLNLRIDDTQDLHVGQIVTRAMAYRDRVMSAHKRPLGLVVVDYLQKLKPSPELKFADKRHQVNHSSERLKKLARDLKLPVIVLAQQKPSPIDKFTGRRSRPDTEAIAESNQVGRDADNLIFLTRAPIPGKGNKARGEDPASVEVIIPKVKSGRDGALLLKFEREFSNFCSHPDAPPPELDDAPPQMFPPDPPAQPSYTPDPRSGPDQ